MAKLQDLGLIRLLRGSLTYYALVAIAVLQAVDHCLGTVRTVIVHHHYLEVELAAYRLRLCQEGVQVFFCLWRKVIVLRTWFRRYAPTAR